MALLDGQYEFRGLVFGEGCDILVNSAEGFEGFEVRSSDSDQPRGDGGIRGLDYVAPRTIAFELVAWDQGDGDGSTYEDRWATVRSTFRPAREADYDLKFKRPGQPERVVRCRPISLTRGEKWSTFGRSGYPPIVLRAADPRIYSSVEHSANCRVYASAKGGADMDWNFDIEFTGGIQNELVVSNNGTDDAYPYIRFFGPVTGTCTGVTLTNTTNGDVLDIDTTVTSGQILAADMTAAVTGTNRLVVSLDGASRYGSWQLPRTAFRLSPGSNVIRLQVDGSSTDVVANLKWRDTWIS